MKKMQVKNWMPAAACPQVLLLGAGMTLMLGLAGCEGIGSGSTLQTLEVRPGNGSTVAAGDSYKLHECIRDQLVVIGTFTDGTAADFSFRARWSSDSPLVEVSNGEIENPFVSEGVFTTSPIFTLRPGTLIPSDVTAVPVTITAEFLGKRSSLSVVVATPSFQISPAPLTTLPPPPPPTHLGAGTFQRFTMVVNRDGRQELAPALNQLGPINPLLWRFAPGPNVAFDARDPLDAADFDKYTITNGTDVLANINVLSGTVTGVQADAASLPIEAHLSLCSTVGGAPATDPAFITTKPELKPLAAARVANFATTSPLLIEPEDDFNGPGVSNGDLATNTNQLLTATANLDTDGDGVGDVTQNLVNQARFNIEPKNSPDGCDATLSCFSNKNLFFAGFGSNDLRTTPGTTGGGAMAQACFPFCVPTQASLRADDAIGAAAPHVVTLTATAIKLTPGISAVSFTFDFGDGTPLVTQPGRIAPPHSYALDGFYTATVRITDSTGATTQNAGAVQIRVGSPVAGNTAPTAALAAFPLSGAAPLLVNFSASGSSDADTNDQVVVFEFDFGDDTPKLRQTSPVANHVYLTQPVVAPTVIVIDESGRHSAPATLIINDAPGTITVTGTVPPERLVRSNFLSFTAVPATLTGIAIAPLAASEPAFTYPGVQFEAIGTFDATSPATFSGGALSATQKITRLVGWAARPAADSTEFSDIAFVRNFSDDLLRTGQVGYLQDVDPPSTDVFITVTPPLAPLATVTAPTPATLTVQPCVLPVCP